MRHDRHLPEHPLRQKVQDEIHARPFEPLRSPCTILKYVFWRNSEIDSFLSLKNWCNKRHLEIPKENARRMVWKDGKAQLAFESHTEFVSLTWIGHPNHVPEADPFSVFGEPSPVMGSLINAVRIDIRGFGEKNSPDKTAEASQDEQLDFYDFDTNSLCLSKCENGKALVATDFRQDEFGLTRFVITDMGMRALSCGVLVRRLSEIETYRTVALLGLPEAQRANPIINELERQLSDIFNELNNVKNSNENQALLNRLYRIAMDLETLTINSQYRFAASRAYFAIVEQRLQALEEHKHLDFVTLKTFLSRRIMPAIHTCNAIERRQDTLAQKISRASGLIRTQLDVDIQAQNQGLLKALNRRSELQYRLQQTVEGLSVVAISYYAVSLLYYVFKGMAAPLGLSPTLLTTLSVPFILLLVWLSVHRIRHHHEKENQDASTD